VHGELFDRVTRERPLTEHADAAPPPIVPHDEVAAFVARID
jgi:hypothetical protein